MIAKQFKRKLSRHEKARYEVPVFELYNNRAHEVNILSTSEGIATRYGL